MKKQLTQYDYLKMIRKPTVARGPIFTDKTKYNRKPKHRNKGWDS